MKPTKAIIPVAGYGTRRLPITKAVEKCMMPILNRPIVDYIVEDCIKAGVRDIYFVVSGGAPQLKNYYARNEKLETYLTQKGKPELLDAVRPPEGVNFHFIEQESPDGAYGTTVPVWSCRDVVELDESVLVIMGDQCLWREDGGSDTVDLIQAVESQKTDAGMVAVTAPDDPAQYYGILAMDDAGRFSHMVEKPADGERPSNLKNASIYLVPGSFWEFLAQDMERPHEGEYMITDVLNDFAAKHSVAVIEAKGAYLDCGNLEGWVAANDYMLAQSLKAS